MKISTKAISAINDLIGNTDVPRSEILTALEEIQEHIAPWVDHIRDAITREAQAAEGTDK